MVTDLDEKDAQRSPYAPFTTSTLQQEANRKLGLSAKETMRLAQDLYENGYITYMRTDSVNLSDQAINAARRRIRELYGEEFLSPRRGATRPRPPTRRKRTRRSARPAKRCARPTSCRSTGGIGGFMN